MAMAPSPAPHDRTSYMDIAPAAQPAASASPSADRIAASVPNQAAVAANNSKTGTPEKRSPTTYVQLQLYARVFASVD